MDSCVRKWIKSTSANEFTKSLKWNQPDVKCSPYSTKHLTNKLWTLWTMLYLESFFSYTVSKLGNRNLSKMQRKTKGKKCFYLRLQTTQNTRLHSLQRTVLHWCVFVVHFPQDVIHLKSDAVRGISTYSQTLVQYFSICVAFFSSIHADTNDVLYFQCDFRI